MPPTTSTMLPLGTTAPEFLLPDVLTGTMVGRDDFRDRPALVVMFICNHCPFVKHIQAALVEFGREFGPKGAAIVAISSNDVANYPDDSPGKMRREGLAAGYPFPYLYDETQEVAKAYRASCTPDFYVFDGERKLVYRGQFDDSRPKGDEPVTGKDLRRATEAVLKGEGVMEDQRPSIGCGIKWKPGNEPSYVSVGAKSAS